MKHRDNSLTGTVDRDPIEVTTNLADLIGANAAIYCTGSDLSTIRDALLASDDSDAGDLAERIRTAMREAYENDKRAELAAV